MSSKRRSEEFSAGGIVLREGEEVLVIVPERRAADGRRVLALPKGHVDPGETPEQAAKREVREEGGVDADLVEQIGDVRYWYRRGGRSIPKLVIFYLFRYSSGNVADHDHEVEEARWVDLREAARTLSYAGEREMVARVLSKLEPDL